MRNTIHILLVVEATEWGIGAAAEKVVAGSESENEKMTVSCSTQNLLRSCVVLKTSSRPLSIGHGGNTGRKNYDGMGFGGTYNGCQWTWYNTRVFR